MNLRFAEALIMHGQCFFGAATLACGSHNSRARGGVDASAFTCLKARLCALVGPVDVTQT